MKQCQGCGCELTLRQRRWCPDCRRINDRNKLKERGKIREEYDGDELLPPWDSMALFVRALNSDASDRQITSFSGRPLVGEESRYVSAGFRHQPEEVLPS